MENQPTNITVTVFINAPVDKVWKCWTEPAHITQWNNASPDWHTPRAENDLQVGGKFLSRMEARDGSMGFDFTGTYTDVKHHERIAYTMSDGRQCTVLFQAIDDITEVIETFEAENQNPVEMQRGGWQAILDSFKAHVEKQ